MISSKNRRVGSIYLVGQLSEQASRRSFGEPAQKAGIRRQSLGTQANEFDLRLPLQLIRPIGAEGLSRRPPAGSCRPFLGPGFRLGARWNGLGETVKTHKKREKTGKKWARLRPKTCEGRELTKDQLGWGVAFCPGAIATVSGVAEATSQTAYQDIYPYLPAH